MLPGGHFKKTPRLTSKNRSRYGSAPVLHSVVPSLGTNVGKALTAGKRGAMPRSAWDETGFAESDNDRPAVNEWWPDPMLKTEYC